MTNIKIFKELSYTGILYENMNDDKIQMIIHQNKLISHRINILKKDIDALKHEKEY
jgi:hypothetical protein